MCNSYQELILPIIYFMRLTGTPLYRRTPSGEITNPDVKAMIYSGVYFIISSAITLYTIIMYLQIGEDIGKGKTIMKYEKIIFLIPMLTGPLPFILQNKKFHKFMKKWKVYQGRYERLTGEQLLLPRNKLLWEIALPIFPLIGNFFLELYYMILNRDKAFYGQFVTFLMFFNGDLLFTIYWQLTAKAIQYTAKEYLKHLKRQADRNEGYTTTVEEYRLLWMRLSSLARRMGSSFCYTTMVGFGFVFFYLTISFYNVVSSIPVYIANSKHVDLILDIVHVIYFIYRVFHFCEVGHQVTKYCTEGILETLLEMRSKSEWSEKQDLRLNLFLYTMNEHPPVMNVSGYFTINRSIFVTTISILLTYIIVILQVRDNL